MTLRRSWPIDKGLPNAVDIRSIERWKWQAAGIIPAPGDQANPAGRTLFSPGTGWGVNLAAFAAALRRNAASDGTSFVSNDATVANAFAHSGAPTTGSRIDVVYTWNPDPTFGNPLTTVPGENDAQGNPRPRAVPVVAILPGTAANGGLGATPTKPSLATYGPDGALEIGTITVPSTATSNTSSGVVFAQTFPYATPVGVPNIWRTAGDVVGVTYDGQEAWIAGIPVARVLGTWRPKLPAFSGGAWHINRASGQSIPNTSETALTGASVATDGDVNAPTWVSYNSTTGVARLQPGVYLVSSQVMFASRPDNARAFLSLYLDGALFMRYSTTTESYLGGQVTVIVPAGTTKTIAHQAYQATGSANSTTHDVIVTKVQ